MAGGLREGDGGNIKIIAPNGLHKSSFGNYR